MGLDIISRFLFPAPPSSYTVESFPEELIWVPKTLDPATSLPEECVPCLFLSYSSARFLIFYLHSNAEDIGKCYPFCSVLREQFQVHVLAVEYPGYGICPGGPCDEQKVTENAFVVFRFVREVLKWPLDSILILGRSIGTGPAISLAVQYQVSGVILVSPFLSVKEVCKDAIGFLAHLVEERFPNKERVPHIRSPFLVVHGKKDTLIPFRHGEQLYELCRSRKLLVCPQDMEHNTNLLVDVGYFVLPMLQFFALPDYCFEEIQVPSWAYDKRLSPYYKEPPRVAVPLSSPTQPPQAPPEESAEDRALDDSVARAVERIFCGRDPQVDSPERHEVKETSNTDVSPIAATADRVDRLLSSIGLKKEQQPSRPDYSQKASAPITPPSAEGCLMKAPQGMEVTLATDPAGHGPGIMLRRLLSAQDLAEIVGDLEQTLAPEGGSDRTPPGSSVL